MIAATLPVFWLVALMYGPWAVSAFSQDFDCAAGNAASPSESAPANATDACLRTEVRRISPNLHPATQPSIQPAQTRPLLSSRHFAPPTPPTGAAYLLQQRWQFVWRTADSPRAPSHLA